MLLRKIKMANKYFSYNFKGCYLRLANSINIQFHCSARTESCSIHKCMQLAVDLLLSIYETKRTYRAKQWTTSESKVNYSYTKSLYSSLYAK